MIHLLFSLYLGFFSPSFALETQSEKNILKLIDSITDLTPQSYYAQLDTLRESVEKFLATKRKVCEGEYSPVILQGQDGTGKAKLDEKAKRQCYKELKKMHLDYLDNMYVARKRFLEYSHKQRLEELARHHEQAVQELKNSIPR